MAAAHRLGDLLVGRRRLERLYDAVERRLVELPTILRGDLPRPRRKALESLAHGGRRRAQLVRVGAAGEHRLLRGAHALPRVHQHRDVVGLAQAQLVHQPGRQRRLAQLLDLLRSLAIALFAKTLRKRVALGRESLRRLEVEALELLLRRPAGRVALRHGATVAAAPR
jgi:hypothetical protein